MPPSTLLAQPGSAYPIGQAVHFVSGPFTNRAVRAQLDELQKADLGRKCGKKDRRPLDPPPIVRLRLFEVLNEGTPQEVECEVEDVKSEFAGYGFICLVDLFPWPPPTNNGEDTDLLREGSGLSRLSRSTSGLPPMRTLSLGSNTCQLEHRSLLTAPYPPVTHQAPPLLTSFRIDNAPFAHLYPVPAPGPDREDQSEVATYADGLPIFEHHSCTSALMGATFVSAACLGYQGRPALLNVFSDLAVNMDGTFLMRYRVLNLFCTTPENRRVPILAECWGGPVRVYPTKDFPGLEEPTEITKYLSRIGVPVNMRQSEQPKKRDRAGRDTSMNAGG